MRLGVVKLGLHDHLVESLLVRLHLRVLADLGQRDVLFVAHRNDLVEREYQLEGPRDHAGFVDGRDILRHEACQEAEGLEILEDIGLAVCQNYQIHIFYGLVHVADVLRARRSLALACSAPCTRELERMSRWQSTDIMPRSLTSVSTYVCWRFPEPTSLGNAERRPSILALVMSWYWRDTRAAWGEIHCYT